VFTKFTEHEKLLVSHASEVRVETARKAKKIISDAPKNLIYLLIIYKKAALSEQLLMGLYP